MIITFTYLSLVILLLLSVTLTNGDIYSLTVNSYNVFSTESGGCNGAEVDYCTMNADGHLESVGNYYYFIYEGSCGQAYTSDHDASDNLLLTIFDSDGSCVGQTTIFNPYDSFMQTNNIGDQIDVNIVANEANNQILISWIFVDIDDSIYYMVLDTHFCTKPNQRQTASVLSALYDHNGIEPPKGCLLSNAKYIVTFEHSKSIYYKLISSESTNIENSQDIALKTDVGDQLIAAHNDGFFILSYTKRIYSTQSYLSQVGATTFNNDLSVKTNEFIIAGGDISGEYQNVYLQYLSSIDVFFVLYQYNYDADLRYLYAQLIDPYNGDLILSLPLQIYSSIINDFCVDQIIDGNQWILLFFGFTDWTNYAKSIILNVTTNGIEIEEPLSNIVYSPYASSAVINGMITNIVCSTMKNQLFIIYGVDQFSLGMFYQNSFNHTNKDSIICVESKADFIFLNVNICVILSVMLYS